MIRCSASKLLILLQRTTSVNSAFYACGAGRPVMQSVDDGAGLCQCIFTLSSRDYQVPGQTGLEPGRLYQPSILDRLKTSTTGPSTTAHRTGIMDNYSPPLVSLEAS